MEGAVATATAAALVLAAGLYVALDPLGLGIAAGSPDFKANYVEQPAPDAFVGFKGDVRNRLAAALPRFVDEVCGPESIAFDPQGRGPYTGVCDGRVLRWDGDGVGWIEFATTSSNRTAAVCGPRSPSRPSLATEHICGRPLGLRFKKSTGELFIADAYFGLMVVGPDGGLAKPLSTEAAGEPLVFTNDLDIAEDGTIYFTDSSTKYQRRQFLLSILEGDTTGRLLKYDPDSGSTTVILRGLRFPNGVSLSKDQSFLVFAESITGRLTRYWLKGPKAGQAELFALLPGHPDNVRTNERGEFWVAIHGKRQPLMAVLGPRPSLREFIVKLPIPSKLMHKLAGGKPHAMLLKYDAQGRMVDALEDHRGDSVNKISEVEEHDGKLWLGTVLLNQMWVYEL